MADDSNTFSYEDAAGSSTSSAPSGASVPVSGSSPGSSQSAPSAPSPPSTFSYEDATTGPGPQYSGPGAFARNAVDVASFGLRPAIEGIVKAGGEGTHPAIYDLYQAAKNAFSSNPDPQWEKDYQSGRDQALAEDKAAFEQHPWWSIGGQLAGGFAAPGADLAVGKAFGKLAFGAPSLLSTAAREIGGGGAGRVASTVAGGAGQGALYGAGSGISHGDTGSDLASDVLWGSGIGAVGGGAGGLLGEGARAAAPRIANLFRGPESQAETKAGNVLRDTIGSPDVLPRVQPTGTPEDVSNLLRNNLDRIDADTQDHYQSVLDSAKSTTGLLGDTAPPDVRGTALREALQSAENSARQKESALWKAVDPNGDLVVSMQPARDAVAGVYGDLTSADAATLSPFERQTANVVGNYRDFERFKELTSLRSNVSSAMREELNSHGRTPTYARLTQLRSGLQDALDGGLQDYFARQAGEVADGIRAPENTAAARLADVAQPIGPANKPARAYSSLEALADAGGLAPNGEIRTIFGGKNRPVPGQGSLIRASGLSPDDALQVLKDRGYLQDASEMQGGPQTLGHNDLYDLLDREARGEKQYPIGTAVERQPDRSELDYHLNNALDDHLQDTGVDPAALDPQIRDRTLQLMERERLDPGVAHEQALMEARDYGAEQGRLPVRETHISGWDVPSDAEPAQGRSGPAEEAWWRSVLDDGAPARTAGEFNRGVLAQERAPWNDFRTEAQPSPLKPNFDRGAQERLEAATAATRERAATFGTEPVRSILKRKGSGYSVPDSKVPEKVFQRGPSGAEAIQAFRKAVGDDRALPLLHDTATDSMLRATRGEDGLIDSAKLATWQKQNAEALRALPPDSAQRYQSAADASRAVADAAAARKQALDEATKGIAGDLIGLRHSADISRTVGSVFGKNDAVAQMQELANRVRSSPEALQGLQRAISDYIRGKTSSAKGIDVKALQDFVRNNEPALRQVFSPDQISIMKAIGPAAAKGEADTLLGKLFKGAGLALVEGLGEIVGAHFFGHGIPGAMAGLFSSIPIYNAAKVAFSKMGEAGLARVNDLVWESVINPQLGRTLLQKVTPKTEANIWRLLGQRLGTSSMYKLPVYGVNDIIQRKSGGRVGGEHRVRVSGLDVVIDTPRGEKRGGTDKYGSRWSVRMPAHYGHLTGSDLKVFLGPYVKSPKVYLIDQYDKDTGKFDQTKVALGFASNQKALQVFMQSFADERGGDRYGHIKELSMDGFKHWLRTREPGVPVQDHDNLKGVARAGRPPNRRERVKSILSRHGVDHSEI